MANENIQVVVSARDNASRTLASVKKNVQALGSKTGGPLGSMIGGFAGIAGPAAGAALVTGMLGAAVGKLGEQFAAGVGSAMAEEKSLARLHTTLEQNIPAWDGNTRAIELAIEAGQKMGFADDDLRAGLAKSVTATRDLGEAYRQYRLAMDLARLKNISHEAATQIVIKASQGQGRALKELGIVIDETTTKTEIYGLMQERLAGQAEAYAQTTEGKLVIANTKVEESFEDMGGTMLPIIGDIAVRVGELTDELNRFVNGAPDLGAVYGTWGSDLAQANIGGRMAEQIADEFAHSNAWGDMTEDGRREMQKVGNTILADVKWPFKQFANNMHEDGSNAGGRFMEGLVDGVRSNKGTVRDIMEDVAFAVNHPMKQARELARIEGALTSTNLAEGLNSNLSWVRAAAIEAKNQLIAQWESLSGRAYSQGASVASGFEKGLRTFNAPAFNVPGVSRGNRHGRTIFGGGRAAGGPVETGRTYLVGERGPELLHVGSRGGNITPNHALGGGGPIVLNVDGRELFRIMDERMGKRLAMASSSAYIRG